MYVIATPLVIIGLALITLTVLVWRKWPYLKKLEPGAHRMGGTFFHDLEPDLVDRLRAFNYKTMWRNVLVGVDELLGHMRAFFVRVDRASARLLKSVRRTHETVGRQQSREAEVKAEQETKPAVDEDQTRREAEQQRLKQREQEIIVQIAQDPKQATLYLELSRIYQRLGSVTDAVDALNAALKIEPENTEARSKLKELESSEAKN